MAAARGVTVPALVRELLIPVPARAAELAKIDQVPSYDAPAMRHWAQADDGDRW